MFFYKSRKKSHQIKKVLLFNVFIFTFVSIYGNSIELNSTRISLNATNLPLKKVLSKIESQSNYSFFYEKNSIYLNRSITIKVINESIGLVLSKVFDQNKVSYKIIDRQIILKIKILKKEIYTIQGKIFDEKDNDWGKLNQIGYNKEFWENNPIIKRTPMEKTIIDRFEKQNAFESTKQGLYTKPQISTDSIIKN
tara:strand:+ start:4946 stop:5530 length:585 start_codon:yes stop_codon:yes gene_type:complete